MYAVAFDLVVADTEQHHPKGVSQAYADIGSILNEHGFRRVQGSLYVTENEDTELGSGLHYCIVTLRLANGYAVGARLTSKQ